jgi:hypothetical protein
LDYVIVTNFSCNESSIQRIVCAANCPATNCPSNHPKIDHVLAPSADLKALQLWVPIVNDHRRNAIKELKIWLTPFICNALARCRTPSSPISFCLRFMVVSVYSEWWSYEFGWWIGNVTHSVHLQCIRQMVGAFSADSVFPKIDGCECL